MSILLPILIINLIILYAIILIIHKKYINGKTNIPKKIELMTKILMYLAYAIKALIIMIFIIQIIQHYGLSR